MTALSPLMPHHHAYVASLRGATEVAHAAREHRPGAATGSRNPVDFEMLAWGVAGDGHASNAPPACEIIASFGEVEAEYAAIRRGAALLDSPHRGTLIVTGCERIDFLNRMLTQELQGLASGQTREAFWLNRKGRIDADLVVIELGDRMLLDLDVVNAGAAAKSLNEFIFTEDVAIRDASDEFHHIGVHGKLAREAIAAAANDDAFDCAPGAAKAITIDNAPVVIARRDQTGETGYQLIVPRDGAGNVWEFLLAADHIVGQDKRRVRPIGWHAFNIARIEAGEALFNIDFGPTNLPHQVGEVLPRRVSFTKGCYLGQEIVARMHSRGHSKPTLVGVRMRKDVLPVAGAQVFAKPVGDGPGAIVGGLGEPIGVVTSSTLSPMLSAEPIALAMLKPMPMGTVVLVNAEGEQAEATIGPLKSWPVPAETTT
jgi:folate-binding protein YgfZ